MLHTKIYRIQPDFIYPDEQTPIFHAKYYYPSKIFNRYYSIYKTRE